MTFINVNTQRYTLQTCVYTQENIVTFGRNKIHVINMDLHVGITKRSYQTIRQNKIKRIRKLRIKTNLNME